ncbi:MICOS complex subunit MIC19 isoform X4 [Kogia breviceps]|uniref:MICOS complex subunit MIC19 isoform X4 n=2 Tax=Kogia breviceps TaxID=27615 RepID=UPI0034D30F01
MGGTASTRRVTFEADENENITVVKGIRLSENVIDRMKETSPSGPKSQRYSGAYGGASVSDEELKRRVAEELALEQAKKESENQKRLKQSKELDSEKAFASEQLTRAILRERITNEEERAKAKHLAKQLEEKDRVIKKQDAFYKEQLARLEERSSEFYRVTTEQYQKAAEEVEAKFKRYECQPICADLQAQILQCYRQNTQQTLSCSALANQYKRCVNQAKQWRLEIGDQVPAWMGSGEDSLPGLQTATLSLCPHMAFPGCMHVWRESSLVSLLPRPPILSDMIRPQILWAEKPTQQTPWRDCRFQLLSTRACRVAGC